VDTRNGKTKRVFGGGWRNRTSVEFFNDGLGKTKGTVSRNRKKIGLVKHWRKLHQNPLRHPSIWYVYECQGMDGWRMLVACLKQKITSRRYYADARRGAQAERYRKRDWKSGRTINLGKPSVLWSWLCGWRFRLNSRFPAIKNSVICKGPFSVDDGRAWRLMF